MQFIATRFDGCYEIIPQIRIDERGAFIKTFHVNEFEKHDLCTTFVEEYYSISKHGVLRGMHFQAPPYDHAKLVYCIDGGVLDVLVDLRKKSATYGKAISFKLNAQKCNILYIPKGIAHGFYTTSASATMVYKTSTVYNPEADAGILWSSFGFKWPTIQPILSARDQRHPTFAGFINPF